MHATLTGDIDFTTTLHRPLGDAIQASNPTVHVNLAAVSFLDSAAIGALVAARRAADEVHASFHLTDALPNVYQLCWWLA